MTGGLFHYKHDTSDDRAYSLNQDDYPRLPLFTMQAPASKRRYLNEVFLLVLDDLPTWRSMNTYAVDTEAQLKLLAAAEHPAIPATSSGPAFCAVPKLSKTLVSYIVGLMVTTPYFRGSCDERAKGLAEQHVTSTLASLNTLNTVLYKKFLQETIVGWFALFPEERAAPRAGRASLAGDEGVDVEEPDEGEEGRIGGELPVL